MAENGIDKFVEKLGFGEVVTEKVEDSKVIVEAVDIKKIIETLRDTDFKGDNKEQMRGLQLLKGLATSDDDLSNKFMEALSDAFTTVAKKVLGGDKEE